MTIGKFYAAAVIQDCYRSYRKRTEKQRLQQLNSECSMDNETLFERCRRVIRSGYKSRQYEESLSPPTSLIFGAEFNINLL